MIKNLSGRKFGKLNVIEIDKLRTARKTYWLCVCECGNTKSVRSDCLQNGNVSSCGCLKKETDRINLIKNHGHKMSNTRIYHVWQGMKNRCLNEKNNSYKNYGGRGIKVCDEWVNSFENFYEWSISNGYKNNLTIDRIDNNDGYDPNNCRWVNNEIQANNRRSNVIVEHNGENVNFKKLSQLTGLSINLLSNRYKSGDVGKRLVRNLFEDRNVRIGTLNNNNKITEDQAIYIKAKLKQGFSPINIHNETNISKHIIYDIKRGKTWTWI